MQIIHSDAQLFTSLSCLYGIRSVGTIATSHFSQHSLKMHKVKTGHFQMKDDDGPAWLGGLAALLSPLCQICQQSLPSLPHYLELQFFDSSASFANLHQIQPLGSGYAEYVLCQGRLHGMTHQFWGKRRRCKTVALFR
jgi:hypothetical protein